MNKIEEIVWKARIALHRFNRNLIPAEERRKERDRTRRWRYHIQYEIPHSSDEINYGFMRKDFLDAITEANMGVYTQRQASH